MRLSKLGLEKGRICEVVVTTYNANGTPNSAAMGVYSNGKNMVFLKVHSETDTAKNILREKCFVVNIIYDPIVFLKSALLGRNDAGKIIEIKDVNKSKINSPYITNANAYIEVQLDKYRKFTKFDKLGRADVYLFSGKVLRVNVLKPYPVAFNRGIGAVVEISILLSRGKYSEVVDYLRIARRCLSNREYREVIDFISKYLHSRGVENILAGLSSHAF